MWSNEKEVQNIYRRDKGTILKKKGGCKMEILIPWLYLTGEAEDIKKKRKQNKGKINDDYWDI